MFRFVRPMGWLLVAAGLAGAAGCCNNSTGSTKISNTSGGTSGSSGNGYCLTDANCSASDFCAAGACTARRNNGSGCSANDACLSGSCQTGSCAACTGDGSCTTGSHCTNGICIAPGSSSGASGASGSSGASGNGSSGASGNGSSGASGNGSSGASGSNGSSGASGASGSGSSGGTACTDGSQCASLVCSAGFCVSPNCVIPTFVTTDLELTTSCPTWYIGLGGTDVEGSASPILTVDPGVTVSVTATAFLVIGSMSPGGLQVNGTAAKPVIFTSSTQTAGSWAGIVFGDFAVTSALSFTTISYGGGAQSALVSGISYPGALAVLGDQTSPVLVALNSVTANNNGANGFVFAGPKAGLAAGSGSLTVSDWAAGSYPFVIDANQAGTLPITVSTGTGSGSPAVALACQGGQDCGNPMTVDHDQTWAAMPMPFSVVASVGVNVEGANGIATLTIAAPNTLEFVDGPFSAFQVDSLILGQGELTAVGTASHHIAFKSVDANPAYNAWQGIQLVAAGPAALQATTMAYCDISDATGFTVAVGGVPGNVSGEITINGSEYANLPDGGSVGPSITNCTFSNYGGCGIFTEEMADPGAYGALDAGAAGNAFTVAPGAAGDGQVNGDVCSI